mmetsp:Transcript_62467/g.116043  ORF Transcript_62467/g.116043 Transcript_62467/m.116043 type:complete len:169 (+) Transcript_62467:56-562(+)
MFGLCDCCEPDRKGAFAVDTIRADADIPGGNEPGQVVHVAEVCKVDADEAEQETEVGTDKASGVEGRPVALGEALEGRVFQVKLPRELNAPLGLTAFNRTGEEFLRIQKVKAAGLVAEWNANNPDMAIMEGHHIVGVNDATTAKAMRKAIGDASVTSLLLTLREVSGV